MQKSQLLSNCIRQRGQKGFIGCWQDGADGGEGGVSYTKHLMEVAGSS